MALAGSRKRRTRLVDTLIPIGPTRGPLEGLPRDGCPNHGLICAIWRDRALPTLLQSFNTDRFTAPQPPPARAGRSAGRGKRRAKG